MKLRCRGRQNRSNNWRGPRPLAFFESRAIFVVGNFVLGWILQRAAENREEMALFCCFELSSDPGDIEVGVLHRGAFSLLLL